MEELRMPTQNDLEAAVGVMCGEVCHRAVRRKWNSAGSTVVRLRMKRVARCCW